MPDFGEARAIHMSSQPNRPHGKMPQVPPFILCTYAASTAKEPQVRSWWAALRFHTQTAENAAKLSLMLLANLMHEDR